MKKTTCVILLGLLFSLPMEIQSQDRTVGLSFATRSEVIAQNGMACTSHPLASQIAIDILKKGGNAIDAAIAANAALGLMEPTGCGIGGDLFAIVWDAESRKLYGLNASGRSPMSLKKSTFEKQGLDGVPSRGPLSVSVPGCVDGWYSLHGKFGSMDMKELLAPAIAYANEGFPVTEVIGSALAASASFMKDLPNFKDTYMANGHMPAKGEIFKNPRLAKTLTKIAEGGRDAFYKGDIAKVIAQHMKEVGGFITYDDMANHRSEWVEPVSTNYRGYDVWELPPNGQGIAALQILNLLEPYDLSSMGFDSPEYVHLFTEAKKLAFEDRAKYYADPAFNEIPVDWLISKEYANQRRKMINESRAARTMDAGKLKDGDTIYLTIADKNGNMVSFIQSNYSGMGSGVVPGDLGFMLQNRGALFTMEDGHFNEFESGKRPFHTIIPAFVTKDGLPFMSFGVMGGDMQPQGHAEIIINMIDFGMNLQEAGDAPRIRHNGSSSPTGNVMKDGGTLNLEEGFSYQTRRKLRALGHKLGFSPGGYGGYQAIMYDPVQKVYFGASESRKDGQAIGY